MNGQMTIFDYLEKPDWNRKCWNKQCSYLDRKDIECYECTALYQCEKRSNDYISLNRYYVDNGCRGMINPVDGITILCSANKAKADESIKQWKQYFYGEQANENNI